MAGVTAPIPRNRASKLLKLQNRTSKRSQLDGGCNSRSEDLELAALS
jgi:hypothetical protein